MTKRAIGPGELLFATLVRVVGLALLVSQAQAQIGDPSQTANFHTNWAVLVAGSNGYQNYRHQADICHVYQMLRSHGMPSNRIITLMYDDVANHPQNPYPNSLFNKPSFLHPGQDVYANCTIDYREDKVTPDNFLNVLLGNNSTALPKVLKSTADDRVFLTFVDHGAPGLLFFPNNASLHALDLIATMEKMVYKELVFYIEACESGSLFENLLPDRLKRNTYITTATNSKEPGWATYCPPFHDLVNGKFMSTCLGDLYTVNWIADSELHNMSRETLSYQYERVQLKTKRSHVTQFGNLTMAKHDTVGDFQSTTTTNNDIVIASARSDDSPKDRDQDQDEYKYKDDEVTMHPRRCAEDDVDAVNSRDVPLVSRFYAYLRTSVDDPKRHDMAQELMDEIQHREATDRIFAQLSMVLLGDDWGLPLGQAEEMKDFACHKSVNQAVEIWCGAYTDYSSKYVATIVNLCEIIQQTDRIVAAVKAICSNEFNDNKQSIA